MEHKYICEDCGEEFTWKGYKPKNRRVCEDCAHKRVVASVVQLKLREGPYYEKWRLAMKHVADTL